MLYPMIVYALRSAVRRMLHTDKSSVSDWLKAKLRPMRVQQLLLHRKQRVGERDLVNMRIEQAA